MNAYLLPGGMGLLIGLLLLWTGFSRATGTRHALGLRRSYTLRSGLTAVGWAIALTALLTWLAVIDVDTIEVLPLSAGALAGGALLGIAAGLCGFTPTTAFAGLGAGNALEALCVLAGCFAGTLLLPELTDLLAPLHTAKPFADATLFQTTLDEPALLDGGFLGQACAGFLLAAIALCIPSPRPVILTDAEVAARAEEIPVDKSPEDTPPEEVPEVEEAPEAEETPEEQEIPDPESTAEETFVALLEGEEPLVVDTELDEDADASVPVESAEAEPTPDADKD